MLKICVWDNGVGMTRERLEQIRRSLQTGENLTTSYGILNVNQRLKLMFSSGYHMDIESEKGKFTCFVLHIPAEIEGSEHKNIV